MTRPLDQRIDLCCTSHPLRNDDREYDVGCMTTYALLHVAWAVVVGIVGDDPLTYPADLGSTGVIARSHSSYKSSIPTAGFG